MAESGAAQDGGNHEPAQRARFAGGRDEGQGRVHRRFRPENRHGGDGFDDGEGRNCVRNGESHAGNHAGRSREGRRVTC